MHIRRGVGRVPYSRLEEDAMILFLRITSGSLRGRPNILTMWPRKHLWYRCQGMETGMQLWTGIQQMDKLPHRLHSNEGNEQKPTDFASWNRGPQEKKLEIGLHNLSCLFTLDSSLIPSNTWPNLLLLNNQSSYWVDFPSYFWYIAHNILNTVREFIIIMEFYNQMLHILV